MDDGMCSACVSAGHVLFFAGGVSKQQKEDVISASLYIQLATLDKYLKYDDFDEWNNKCKKLMTLSGWLSLRENSQHYMCDGQAPVQLDKALLTLLEASVPATLLAHLRKFLADPPALSGGQAALTLLSEYAMDSRPDTDQASLSLQISFVDAESMITTVFLSSKMLMPNNQVDLCAHFAAERTNGSLDITVVRMEFVERQYRRVRGRILAEVGAVKNTLVIALEGGKDE